MDIEAKYFLGTITLDNHKKLELTPSEYISIQLARRILGIALNIEEKYDLALCNYLEFEKEQLILTLDNLANSVHFDYHHSYKILSTLNRRLVNFLSTAKQYTERVAGLASKCSTNESETENTISTLLSKHYDDTLDYRAMEALRNHVNHYGLAVHTISTPSKWTLTEQKKADQLVFNLEIYAEKTALAENSKFKRNILDELPDRYDLKKGARAYIGAISHVHEEVRRLIGDSADTARKTIEAYLKSYANLNDGDSFAVGAFIVKNGEEIVPHTVINLSWDDVRIELQKKNISVSNMINRHISSSIVIK
ncbi:hypothetical protein [Pseudomonas viridiflava]|uniref:hypothetical protein n=1 Tax=Pseudomonas viridiflava TaxID=33069 RepID=UPI000F059DF6|nr:hypothetical protein [Pseudomonas viridiflava]